MSEKSNRADKISRHDYIRLAELSHAAFSERRQYEWKINFAFWGSLALLVYAIVRENILHVFQINHLYLFGSILFSLYLFHIIMISRAHNIDKEWKHYYLDRAEGLQNVKRPQPYGKTPPHYRFAWIIVQIIFTASLIILVIGLLSNMKKAQNNLNKEQEKDYIGKTK